MLALCWLLPAAGCIAQSRDDAAAPGAISRVVFYGRQEADLTGTYQGHAPKSDAAQRVFTLELAADGSATLTTLYIGKDNAKQYGRWTRSGRQVVVSFNAMGANLPPRPITFRHRDHELSPIEWDWNEWGRSGPPVLHRSRPGAMQGGL